MNAMTELLKARPLENLITDWETATALDSYDGMMAAGIIAKELNLRNPEACKAWRFTEDEALFDNPRAFFL